MGRVKKQNRGIMAWGCAKKVSEGTFKHCVSAIWAFSTLILIFDIVVLAIGSKYGIGTTTAGGGLGLGVFGYIVAGFGTSITSATTKDHATVKEAVFIATCVFLSIGSLGIVAVHIFLLSFATALKPTIWETALPGIWITELVLTAILCMVSIITTAYMSCCKWNASGVVQQRIGTPAAPAVPKEAPAKPSANADTVDNVNEQPKDQQDKKDQQDNKEAPAPAEAPQEIKDEQDKQEQQ